MESLGVNALHTSAARKRQSNGVCDLEAARLVKGGPNGIVLSGPR